MLKLKNEMLIDVFFVTAFVIYSVSMGFVFRKKASQNLEEYFLAGRSLKGWQAGFSMAATQYAADTPLLVTGLIATAGVFSLWRLWIYAIAFLLMGFVLGASWRRASVLTDAELTVLRYGGKAAPWLRILKAIHLGTLVNCTVLAMVLIAATRIAEPFLRWDRILPSWLFAPVVQWMQSANFLLTSLAETHPEAWVYSANNLISIGAILAFVWLYSATGGLRSVVSTDVVQFAIAMLATFLYAWFVTDKVGGLSALPQKLKLLYGSEVAQGILSFGPPSFNEATLLFCAVLAVQWFAQVNADGTGYLAQRTMACRTDRDARAAAVTFTFAQILFRSLLWLPIAIGLLILYPVESLPAFGTAPEEFRLTREATFAWGVHDLLPAGIRGLMLTGLLAALASTVDTHLNWGASYWANDLYQGFLMERLLKRRPSSRELVWVARLSTLGILGVALLIGVHLKSIQAAWHLSLLFGSGLGVVLILRWIWHRINLTSEIAAIVCSLVCSPVLLFGFPSLSEGARLLWMTGISTLAVLAVTLLTPPESEETLRTFYARARPFGFWAPIARGLKEDPRQPQKALFMALSATTLASLTAFFLLVGLGTLLLQAPRGIDRIWPLLAIGIGLGLIPVWATLGLPAKE